MRYVANLCLLALMSLGVASAQTSSWDVNGLEWLKSSSKSLRARDKASIENKLHASPKDLRIKPVKISDIEIFVVQDERSVVLPAIVPSSCWTLTIA